MTLEKDSDNIPGLLSPLIRVRTFLGLTGGVVLVSYLVFRAILGLGIYAPQKENNSFILLMAIVNRVFVLALIAVTASAVGYLAKAFRKSDDTDLSLEKNTEIVDIGIANQRDYRMSKRNDDVVGVEPRKRRS